MCPGCSSGANSLPASVDVEAGLADEPGKGDVEGIGELDREGRRRAYGSDDRDPCDQSFLQQLKAGPPTQHQHGIAQVGASRHQLRADQFVESATMNPAFEESAMFENMIDLMFKDEYDVYVFDTAPTANARRLWACPPYTGYGSIR